MTWYPDSGASHHVSIVSQNIQQTSPFKGPNQITIGNGQGLFVRATGSTKFKSPLNPRGNLLLNNILDVPSVTKNLLSVSEFSKDNDIYFKFHPNACVVNSQDSNETVLKGPMGRVGIYQFKYLLSNPVTSTPYLLNLQLLLLSIYNSTSCYPTLL